MMKRIIGIAIIVFVTALIYLPALTGDWIWDDGGFVSENPIIKASNGLKRFWASTEPPDYFPLTSTTLWAEWRLWGMKTTGYHVTNLLLHIISALLIWLILLRLKVPLAWLCAFIFAVHPVNLEAVAWITQRKTVLPMVFYLLSILLYLKYEKNRRPLIYALSLIAFILALLSKTSVIMLPFVLLLCAWWQRGKVEREDIRSSVPFFVSAFVMGLVTIWFQYNRSIGDDIVRTDGFLSRFAGSAWTVWFYLYKALFPVNLSFVYPRWSIDPAFIGSYLPGVLLAAVLFVCWRYRNSWGRSSFFALAYFVVTLFPFMGFLNIYYMRYSLVADHYEYQSIIAIIALAVGLCHYWINRSKTDLRRWAIAAAAVIICLLCIQTWRQSHIYRNVEILFNDTLAKNPSSWMAHYNQGHYFQEQGRDAEAMRYYAKAFLLDPENPDPLNNAGNILLKQGKTDKAVGYFSMAVRVRPDFGEGYYNMGVALQQAGKTQEAIDQYYKSIKAKPGNEKAHNNLANALAGQGRYSQALSHYDEALRIKPGFVDAHVNEGIVLKRMKKYDEALKHFYEALRIQPNYVKARKNAEEILKIKAESGQNAASQVSAGK